MSRRPLVGSIAVISDAGGAVLERLAYDAWGKRRFPDGADDPNDTISSLTPFGFTEHRHLQAVALVHMEGRVYDPCVGRFTSADPWVADPASSQSFNRYSYVRNNPTSRIDPSGYQDGAAWGGIGTWSWNLPPPAVPSGATPLPVIVVTPDGDLPGNLGWSWGMSDSAARVLGGPFVAPSWGVPYYTPGVPYFTPPSVSGPSTWEPGPGLAPGITAPTDPGIPGKWPQSPEAAARELSFWIHGTLTAASFAPSVVGSIASAVDTVVYGIEGDWIGVQIGLASTVVGAVSSAGIVKVGLTAAKQASVGSRLTRGTAGRFSDLAARASKGDKLTPHHMPQVAAGFTNRAEGGALMLPEAEHILTRTYGLKGALTARQEAGMAFRDVLARDIRDVRSIGGSQYNQGLWDLMDYYRTNFPELMQKR